MKGALIATHWGGGRGSWRGGGGWSLIWSDRDGTGDNSDCVKRGYAQAAGLDKPIAHEKPQKKLILHIHVHVHK